MLLHPDVEDPFEAQLAARRALDGSCIVPSDAPADLQHRLRTAAVAATARLLDDHRTVVLDHDATARLPVPGAPDAQLHITTDPYGMFVLEVHVDGAAAHLELAPAWLAQLDVVLPVPDADAA